MTRFIFGENILEQINGLITCEGPTDLAVAFWGVGAADHLGLTSQHRNVRIVCDALSGACHPKELQKLLDLGAKVYVRNGLHAKVYLFNKSVIVGSANASANGFGKSAGAMSDELEAAVHTDDPDVLANASHWFDRQIEKSMILDRSLLKRVHKKWLQRQRANIFCDNDESSLFLQLARSPNDFDSVPISLGIFTYDAAYSKLEKEAWKQLKNKHYSDRERTHYDKIGRVPIYLLPQELNLAAGDYLINYWSEKLGDNIFGKLEAAGGAWQVFGVVKERIAGNLKRVLLAREISDVGDLKSSKKEYANLRKHLSDCFLAEHATRSFSDALIPFSKMPTQAPKLFGAVRAWAGIDQKSADAVVQNTLRTDESKRRPAGDFGWGFGDVK